MSDAPDDIITDELVLRVRVKAELRKRMRGLRKTTPAEACAERSRAIVARLGEHAAVAAARSVALFWPIDARHEVDLRPLDEALRARGARVAYPAIDPGTGVMTFRFVEDVGGMAEQGYGFMEPPPSALEALALDVIVVPALAVDPTGHRIGYGAGYYDRALARHGAPTVSIGVAYDWQLIAEVPATEHDVRCAWVVTDLRAFDAR